MIRERDSAQAHYQTGLFALTLAQELRASGLAPERVPAYVAALRAARRRTGPAADAWEPGSIVKIGWAESVLELEKDYVAAYQIQLANSEDLVYAPNDTDEYVRPFVESSDDAPPAKKRKLDK